SIYTLSLHDALPILDCWRKMRKFDLSLRSSRSSYFATFRHQLTILSKTDALDEEKWLNMLGTFVKDWFRYESHFVHGRDSLVDIDRKSGSAGMPRPISYAVFCLKKKKKRQNRSKRTEQRPQRALGHIDRQAT